MTRFIELTAVFRKVPEGYIGFVEELAGARIAAQREGARKLVVARSAHF